MTTRRHSLVPRRILCATDFSARSTAALKFALLLARACGAEVRVLHVAPLHADMLALDSEARADIDHRLESFIRSTTAPGVTIRRVRREGTPCAEIVREIRDEQADLVVMGRHSRSEPAVALGSVTEGVARESPSPVIVVDGGGGDEPVRPRHLLCALDLGETSRETLAHAVAWTSALDADLLVLHVAAANDPAATSPDTSGRLTTLVAEAGLPPSRVRQQVVCGEPFPAILDAVRREQLDLMVVGLHAGGLGGRPFLGSTTLRLLRHAECALLLVPAPASAVEDAWDDEGRVCLASGRGRSATERDARGVVIAAGLGFGPGHLHRSPVRGLFTKQDTKRPWRRGSHAKLLLELVELTGIEPVTS